MSKIMELAEKYASEAKSNHPPFPRFMAVEEARAALAAEVEQSSSRWNNLLRQEIRVLTEDRDALRKALKGIEISGTNLFVALRAGGPEYGYDDWEEMAADIAQDARAALGEQQ